jgi:endonuclease YncB( thermonuclease family)
MFKICSLLLCLTLPAAAQTLSGPVRVIDADTFDIGAPMTIRLIGIDAPEAAQTCRDGQRVLPCGEMATAAARRLYAGKQAVCRVQDTDRYGRALATCRVDGMNVNAELVRLGIARRYREDMTYAEQEKEAALMARGLWAYEMANPADWRAAMRAERAEARAPAAGQCPIKGNISDNGRLYHMPGDHAYGRTRISPERGERWFCSEAEARAAGWRRAGG